MGRTEFQTWILTTSEPGLAEQKQQLQRDEMALFHERMLKYARKLLDTADIVREAMLRQRFRHWAFDTPSCRLLALDYCPLEPVPIP
jgi:hypothetical protein